MKTIFFLYFLVIALTIEAKAQDSAVRYTLFRPVPKEKLRPMETDRPDVTESPKTVDAGHFQYESDLFLHERTNSEEGSKKEYLLNQANFKFGIFSSTALQFIFQSYVIQTETSASEGIPNRSHGIGDLTLRVKQNITGNDKGRFALAVLPYVKFPTSAVEKGEYEGGIIVPMSLDFSSGWRLGMQLEADRLQNELAEGHHTEFLESLSLNYEITSKLDAIGETYSIYDLEHHQWNNFLNAVLQMEIAKDVKIDGGLNYGIQQNAKRSYFIGLSFRL